MVKDKVKFKTLTEKINTHNGIVMKRNYLFKESLLVSCVKNKSRNVYDCIISDFVNHDYKQKDCKTLQDVKKLVEETYKMNISYIKKRYQ